MGKQLGAIFLALVMLTVLLPATVPEAMASTAASGYCGKTNENGGKNVKWTLSKSGTLTISGEGAIIDTTRVSIPLGGRGYVQGLPWPSDVENIKAVVIKDGVTSIGGMAFAYCWNIAKVTIADSVTSISGMAFVGCSSLTEVTIPRNVRSYRYDAFANCYSLKKITVDAQNPYFKSQNGIMYSKDSRSLLRYPPGKTATTFTIPDSVTHIGEDAFSTCRNLSKIAIPDSVTGLGDRAFAGCVKLTDIAIPNNVIEIGDETFVNCSELKKFNIPKSVEAIGRNAFGSTKWYTNQPDGILYFGDWCLGFKKVQPTGALVFKKGTKKFSRAAFFGCTGLTSVTIPEGVTTIASSMFNFCTGLTSVTIPDSVTTIETQAFYDCKALPNIVIPDSVTEIKNMAFENCTALTGITIPDSVTRLGDRAFAGCTALAAVTIPDSVTSADFSVFINCPKLTVYHTKNLAFDPVVLRDAAATVLLDRIEHYTVVFNKNGGTGAMSKQLMTREVPMNLLVNTYTRKGYLFNGWNTKANGSGTKYTNKKSVRNLGASGKTVTLYAVWAKVSAPTKAVTSLKLTAPAAGQLTVSFKGVSDANGYRIQYSTSQSFTKSATKTVHTTKLTHTLKSLAAQKTYYVKVTAYKTDSRANKIYSSKSATTSLKTK